MIELQEEDGRHTIYSDLTPGATETIYVANLDDEPTVALLVPMYCRLAYDPPAYGFLGGWRQASPWMANDCRPATERWLEVRPNVLTLKPHERQRVEISFTVPPDADEKYDVKVAAMMLGTKVTL